MCNCIGCKHRRGEVSGDEYKKYLEDIIKEAGIETNKETIAEDNKVLIEFLKNKEIRHGE